MKTEILIFILTFFIASVGFSRGGDEKGNGGNFLACQSKNSNTSYELLDFYEASAIHKYELAKVDATQNWHNIVTEKIKKLEKISPMRGAFYYEIYSEILYGTVFLKGGMLSDSEDVGPIMMPKNCNLVQAATQVVHPVSQRRSYYINSEIWDQIDNVQKAGLVLHEIILVESIESAHKTSKRTRHMNGFLHSTQFESLSTAGLRRFIESNMGFRFEDYDYFWVEHFDENQKPCANEFYSNGNPKNIFTKAFTYMCWGNACWKTYPDKKLSFYENGWLQSGHAINGEVDVDGKKKSFSGDFQFDENALLKAN